MTQNLPSQPFLNVQFSGVTCMYIVELRAFSSARLKLCPIKQLPVPPAPQ